MKCGIFEACVLRSIVRGGIGSDRAVVTVSFQKEVQKTQDRGRSVNQELEYTRRASSATFSCFAFSQAINDTSMSRFF